MFLDALLADLKASVTPVSTYESKWETNTTTEYLSETPSGSRVATFDRSQTRRSPEPPPLPPLPSKEVLDSLQNSQVGQPPFTFSF